jgi:hypothetical protein
VNTSERLLINAFGDSTSKQTLDLLETVEDGGAQSQILRRALSSLVNKAVIIEDEFGILTLNRRAAEAYAKRPQLEPLPDQE